MQKNLLLFVLLLVFSVPALAANHYWIGGSGNWNDPNHWSLTSGGASGVTTPGAADNAIFDNNSGLLSLANTVSVNVAVTVENLDFSGVSNAFTFNSPAAITFEIQGSILGNASGVSFTGTWGEITLNAPLAGEVVSSMGTVWIQDFRIIGNTIDFTDDFNNGTSDFFVDAGGFNLLGNTLTCGNFLSNTVNPRSININNSRINALNGYWELEGTNLSWIKTASAIYLNDNAGLAEFLGGGMPYDTLRSTTATDLNVYNSNDFKLIELVTSSHLAIENGETLRTDSLIAGGSCTAPLTINTIGAGQNASFEKTGFPLLEINAVEITKVDAIGTATYNVYNATLVNAANWTPTSGIPMFWIGNSGNWGDGNHWSLSSGGVPSGCLPNSSTPVFFDANSFSLPNQTVLVDVYGAFASMDWSQITSNQSFDFDSTLQAHGDITLHPDLIVGRTFIGGGITFKERSLFTTSNAEIDASFLVRMDITSDSLLLFDNLLMSDNSAIVMHRGTLSTQNNDLRSGTLLTFNDETTATDVRTLDFGSSSIQLTKRLRTVGDTNLVVNAGTSHLYIGDTVKYVPIYQNSPNGMESYGHTFYDVTLNFSELGSEQRVLGNNTFNKLRILPGSKVFFEELTTQTINDSLLLNGKCNNVIKIGTTDSSNVNPANLNLVNNRYDAEALVIRGMSATGVPLTVYHSADSLGNTGFTFDATPAVTALFVPNQPSYCFGDTAQFTNLSTVQSGQAADLTSQWYYQDGSTGYWSDVPPPGDSVFIRYELDTNQHEFIDGGTYEVQLIAVNNTNQCRDTAFASVTIYRPSIDLSYSTSDTVICLGDEVVFEAFGDSATVQYEYFLNGLSVQGPSLNDLFTTTALADLDTVSVLAFEGGCYSDTMPSFVFSVLDLPVFSFTSSDVDMTICAGDSVYFTAQQLSEPTYSYQFLLNGGGVTFYNDSINVWGVDTLANNDLVSAVVEDLFGCRDTMEMIFTVNSLPTTSLSSSVVGNVICDGDVVTFTGAGADLYEFFINDVSVQGPSASNTFATTLSSSDTVTVNGLSLAGCDSMALERYFYIVNPIPSTSMISSDFDNSICSGEEVTFTASGASLYEFFVNGSSVQLGFNNTYVTDTLNNGDVVIVEGSFGACIIASAPFNMTVLTSPTTTLVNNDNGDNTICLGTPLTFTASGATNYEFLVNGVSVQGPSTTAIYNTSNLINGQEVTVIGESNTCFVEQSQTFIVLNNPSVSFFSSDVDNTICDGNAINFTAANAGSYEFFVNGISAQGPSSQTILSNPAMNIGINPVQVVGIAGNGCTDTSAIFNVTVNAIPNISLFSSDMDNIICANEQVTFTGSGGSMYQFFVGATPQGAMSPTTTFSSSNLLNGQTITVLGSLLGCPSTSTGITMTVNPIPSMSLISTDVNNVYCEGDLVNYTAGGATNYQFFVNGVSQGAPSPLNTINSSGFPTSTFPLAVVGETNNCYDTTTLTIVINSTPVAGLSNSAINNTICQGESVTYTASGGSLYKYFVNGASQGAPTVNNTITLSSLTNGAVISVVAISAQGCSDTTVMLPLTVNPAPATALLSSDPNNAICIGDNVDFTGSGATEYQFFINGISQGPPGTNPVFSTTGLTNGNNITVVGTQLGCSTTSNNLNFSVFGYPVVSLINNGELELCTGENTDLAAVGANNYQFQINSVPFGPFSTVSAFNAPLNNGDVVTVLGETNGCVSSAQSLYTFTVNAFPVTNSNVSPATTICFGDTVTVVSSGASNYQFDINGTVQQFGASATFETDQLENGDAITVIGFNGDCPSAPETFNFNVNTMNLNLVVSPSSMICEGDPVTFTATGADEYEFLLNGTVVSPMSANNTYTSSTISDLDEITFIGFNSTTQCTQLYEDFIVMNVPEAPSISALSNTTFCEGDSVVLVSNGLYGNQWYVDGNPIPGAIDTQYVAYSSGAYSLEITSGGLGDVWSFGQNATGAFGNGNNFNSTDPTAAASTVAFDELSAGEGFVLGVTPTGDLYAWGENSSGQLGNGTYTSSNLPQVVPTVSNIKTVAASKRSVMAATNSGDVYVWGQNTQGQLGTGNTAIINFPFLNGALNNTDSIAAGEDHFVILKNDGTVWAVGNNNYGQLGNGSLTGANTPLQVPGLVNVQAVGAGDFTSYAILSSGALMVWGNNGSGQLGLGDLNNRLVPTLSNLENVVEAEGGATHSVFRTDDAEIFTTGGNSFGQLGIGTFNDELNPKLVDVSGVSDISVGQFTTLVHRNDRSVFGFGNNTEDQLSSSNGTTINAPEHISDLDGVSFIVASKDASHVIYNEEQLCTSSSVNVTMNAVQSATITATDDVLSTIAGASYQWYFEGNPIPGATNQTYPANESGNYSVQVTLPNGCISYSDVYYHSMSSLESLEAHEIHVYPNPSNGIFNLDLGEISANLVVLDLAGKVVYEQANANGITSIDLSNLERAMYVLQIHSANGTISKKLVKQD